MGCIERPFWALRARSRALSLALSRSFSLSLSLSTFSYYEYNYCVLCIQGVSAGRGTMGGGAWRAVSFCFPRRRELEWGHISCHPIPSHRIPCWEGETGKKGRGPAAAVDDVAAPKPLRCNAPQVIRSAVLLTFLDSKFCGPGMSVLVGK